MTDSLTKQYFVIEEFNGIAGRVYAYSAHRGVYSARMSVPGHLQTCPAQDGMSASPLKADIGSSGKHVR
jgi:hypothetical protein